MKKLVFTGTVKELKNYYTIEENISEIFVDVFKPMIKKVLFGTTIIKPTSYRIYKGENFMFRTWVINGIEINPNRHNLNKITKII